MEAQDYPIAHFFGMNRLAEALGALPAQILEHRYSYESFGSWSVVLRYKGQTSEISFDGKEQRLALRPSVERKPPYMFGPERTLGEGVKFRDLDAHGIEAICRELTS